MHTLYIAIRPLDVLKYAPCAYCGTTIEDRTKGHVFPRSIYPDNLPTAKRITVPECLECKSLWEDAEPHFRNVLLAIWNPEITGKDSRADKFWRSLTEKDGKRRGRALLALMRPSEPKDQGRTKLYSGEDQNVGLILRRIVRGLVHHHGLGSAIHDSRVQCNVMRWAIPPAFETDFTWHTIAPDFIAYGYTLIDEPDAHSFWLLRFSKHILFFGHVAGDRGGEQGTDHVYSWVDPTPTSGCH